MDDWLDPYYSTLLGEAGLPTDTLARARRFFFRADGSDKLLQLPLSPEEIAEIGRVVAQAPSNRSSLDEAEPIAPLPRGVRQKLRVAFDEGGPHAEAALFVLSQDLRIRAFNRALAEKT